MLYLDNAATTYPKPHCVQAAMARAMLRYGANPGRSGHDMSIATAEQIYGCRVLLAQMFGLPDPQNVAFTSNCSGALNQVIQGVLGQGDHIIISDLEHNSVLRPVHNLFRTGKVTYDLAQVVESNPEKTVQNFAKRLKPNTRMIFCTHCSNAFGIMLPIERLARLAHESGILFGVDAAQTAGIAEINMKKMGIDFLCMPGHKGLYGPTGTGALLTTRPEKIAPLLQGGTGTSSLSFDQPGEMPEKLESGTINTVGIVGLKAGAEYVQKMGLPKIYRHEISLLLPFYDFLKEQKEVQLYTKRPDDGMHMPLVSFNIQGMGSEEIAGQLNRFGIAVRAGLHCSPLAHIKYGTDTTGAVRVSFGIGNSEKDVRLLCGAVEKIIQSAGKNS